MIVVAPTVRLHASYDLTIRFGTQTRTKCAGCGRYFTVQDGGGQLFTGQCRCGIEYVQADNGRYRVVRLP